MNTKRREEVLEFCRNADIEDHWINGGFSFHRDFHQICPGAGLRVGTLSPGKAGAGRTAQHLPAPGLLGVWTRSVTGKCLTRLVMTKTAPWISRPRMRSSVVIVGGGIVGLATALAAAAGPAGPQGHRARKRARPGSSSNRPQQWRAARRPVLPPGRRKPSWRCAACGRCWLFAQNTHLHHQCGKVVAATTPEEAATARTLWNEALPNGLQGLRKLNPAGLKEVELMPRSGRHPRTQEGIVDYPAVTAKLGELIIVRGRGPLRHARHPA